MHHKHAKTKISQVKQVAKRQDKHAQHHCHEQISSNNRHHTLNTLCAFSNASASSKHSYDAREAIPKTKMIKTKNGEQIR